MRYNFWLVLVSLTTLLLAALTLAVAVGSVTIPPAQVWAGLTAQSSEPHQQIIWAIRLPRVLLAALVGAGLSVVGVTLQAVVRNPLADPYVLGASSGASLGAALVLVFQTGPPVSLGAFLGAAAALAVVFGLARQNERLTPTRLILSGVAVSYLFAAATSFIALAGSPVATRSVLFWLLGGLSGTSWNDLGLPALVLLAGSGYLLLTARSLNALCLGEESAAILGVEAHALRRRLFVVASLVTGVVVAVSGSIGFVGLIVPHVARLFVGADHRRVLPVAFLSGAVFLTLVDLASRTLLAPGELPLGILTALIGAPFFLWLMQRR